MTEAGIEPGHARAVEQMGQARVELFPFLPDRSNDHSTGVLGAAALFARVAGDYKAIELLLENELTTSAAIVARTVVFGALKLAWCAAADSELDLDTRLLSFRHESLLRERTLNNRARQSGGDEDKVAESEVRGTAELAGIEQWFSGNGVSKSTADEIRIAAQLGEMGLITAIAGFNGPVHVNRVATDGTIAEHPDGTVIGDRPDPVLAQMIFTASVHALGMAAKAFLSITGLDEDELEQVKVLAEGWFTRSLEGTDYEP